MVSIWRCVYVNCTRYVFIHVYLYISTACRLSCLSTWATIYMQMNCAPTLERMGSHSPIGIYILLKWHNPSYPITHLMQYCSKCVVYSRSWTDRALEGIDDDTENYLNCFDAPVGMWRSRIIFTDNMSDMSQRWSDATQIFVISDA